MECYIKAYILELQKKLRVYLLDEEGCRSSISIQLLDALNPYLHIPEDQDGSFVTLTLAFGPDKYQFQFDVIDTGNYDIYLGKNHLANYDLDSQWLYLDGVSAQVYHRGRIL